MAIMPILCFALWLVLLWSAGVHGQSSSQIQWSTSQPGSFLPTQRAFHATTSAPFLNAAFPDDILLFGGMQTQNVTLTALTDIWLFTYGTQAWKQISTGFGAKASVLSTLVSWSIETVVVLFGGVDATFSTPTNDLWFLSPVRASVGAFTMNVTSGAQLHISGIPPNPRFGHAAAVVENAVYIFSGFGANFSALTDAPLWRLSALNVDFSQLSWQPVTTAVTPPSRGAALFCGLGTGMLLASGAANGASMPMQDTWVLTFPDNVPTWTQVQNANSTHIISVVFGSLACGINGGGSVMGVAFSGLSLPISSLLSSLQNPFGPQARGDVVTFSIPSQSPLTSFAWTIIPEAAIWDDSSSLAPTNRIGASMVPVNNPKVSPPNNLAFFLVGGYNPFSNSFISDLWATVDGMSWVNMAMVLPGYSYAGSMLMIGDQLAVFAGQENSFNPRFHISMFNPFNSVWTNAIFWTEFIQTRFFATCVLAGNTTVVFAGMFITELGVAQNLNDTWIIQMLPGNAALAYQLSFDSSIPNSRNKHTAVMQNNTMIVFGGTNNIVDFNDTWTMQFNVATTRGSWKLLVPNTNSPPSRAAHAAALLYGSDGPKMYAFGGQTINGMLFNDMWELNLQTWIWTRVMPQSSAAAWPSARALMTCAVFGMPPSIMVIYGGALSSTLTMASDELWMFTAATLTWTQVNAVGTTPPPLFGAMAVASLTEPNTMWLFGGSLGNGNIKNTLQSITLGCQPGTFSLNFPNISCSPCPVGEFTSEYFAAYCFPCPAGLTTAGTGSTQLNNCSVCAAGACNGHGDCRVTFGQAGPSSFDCDCNFWYRTSKQCDVPTVAIAFALCFLGTGMFVVVAGNMMRRLRRKRKLQIELRERMLEEAQAEVQELERIWQINSSELLFERRLGAGAFGEVWLAKYHGRQVAVKRVIGSLLELDDQLAISEFTKEMKFLRSLRHPNIVFFYGAGDLTTAPFLVTEYMARGTLYDVLYGRDGQPPEPLDTQR